jgi:hypothetical protein
MSTYDKQIGGKHYLKYKIQPSKFVTENKLLYPEGSVIKYVIRHQDKGGKEDLEKAKHMIDMIIGLHHRIVLTYLNIQKLQWILKPEILI